jgi:hypothetical protein
MEDVPRPDVLNPDRLMTNERSEMTLEEHRSRARLLDDALHETCDYAQQLWDRLDAMRHYLVDMLPEQPAEGARLGCARPAGPDDEQGWWDWRNAYAGVTSILAGPHEDSGFGADEADQIARGRLAFSGGDTPTPETIEGPPRPDPSDVRIPEAPTALKAAGAFVAGLGLGWLRGRSRRAA